MSHEPNAHHLWGWPRWATTIPLQAELHFREVEDRSQAIFHGLFIIVIHPKSPVSLASSCLIIMSKLTSNSIPTMCHQKLRMGDSETFTPDFYLTHHMPLLFLSVDRQLENNKLIIGYQFKRYIFYK